jgi:diguanylate cyclase (GGDEF)-like protein
VWPIPPDEAGRLATRDPLTGLANRTLLEESLSLALRQRLRSRQPLGLLSCDTDSFKEVNDTFGHDTGDFVLTAIAQRLSEAARASDLVTRIAGDEFVVMCPELAGADDVALVAERLDQSVSTPLSLGDSTIVPRLSIGCAFARDADTVDTLIRRADEAMYVVKRQHRRAR